MTVDLPQEELLRRLAAIATEADPPPQDVLHAARAALALRRLDAELAELVHDSALEPAAVRGDGERLLSFEVGDTTVELSVSSRAGRVDVLGQLVGPGPAAARVAAETPAGRHGPEAGVDEDGTFRLPGLPPGPTRFHLRAAGSPRVTTSWVTL